MIAFQLDQCLDSKRFARDCAGQGLCQTLRLPPSLRDADDPDLLQALLAAPSPLVTFDRALPHDHTASIPPQHAGIIVISNFPAPQTMTIRIAQRILAQFKAAFPEWHLVPWSNSVVELTTLGVVNLLAFALVHAVARHLDPPRPRPKDVEDPGPCAGELEGELRTGFA